MAYIAPNSTILLIKGVPFEPDYDHTVLFPDASSQAAVIHGSAKYTLNPNTYQRVNKNTCRVGIVADNLYDCNYMAFQNTNFGSKWFYAFIKEVNYINNECTEIVYEIDSFQTYLFDFRIGDCFVEREHPITDELGQNYIPEGLSFGDLVIQGSVNHFNGNDKIGIFFLVATDEQGVATPGNLYDYTFQGGSLFCIPLDPNNEIGTETEVRSFLSAYNNAPDKIIAIWTGPYYDIHIASGTHRVTGYGHDNTPYGAFQIPQLTGNESFGNYVPKNKKLYTYPYTAYIVTTTTGEQGIYKYEYFEDEHPQFQIYRSHTFPAELTAIPIRYKGSGGTAIHGNEGISLKGWAAGSWTSDTWGRMLNVSAIDLGLGIFRGAMGSAITGKPISMAIHGAGGVAGLFDVITKRDYIAPTNHGSASAGSVAANGALEMYGARYGISEQMARVIDNYFDMYGYQTNRLKTPEINSRPHWNYVKVSYADVHGNVPAEHIVNIKNALIKGITFWKSMSEVGHYEYDNRPY